MNVWRGFTLTIWTVVLALLATFFMQYHAFQSTALSSSHVKTELKKRGVYEGLRDTYLRDTAKSALVEKYPDNKLVDDALINSVLAETVPSDILPSRLDPVVDASYRWLDSKEPEILFAVDLSDREAIFYRSLEVQLGKKIAQLPSCGDYRYPPEEAVLNDRCIPAYTTDEEVTDAIVEAVKVEGTPLKNPITSEAFSLPQSQRAVLKQIPTYLNYLWVLNVVALIFLVLITIFLLVSRRMVGVLSIGVALVLAGIAVLVTTPIIGAIQAPTIEGLGTLLQNVIDAFTPNFKATSTRYGMISLGIGLTIVIITTLLTWRRRKQHAK